MALKLKGNRFQCCRCVRTRSFFAQIFFFCVSRVSLVLVNRKTARSPLPYTARPFIQPNSLNEKKGDVISRRQKCRPKEFYSVTFPHLCLPNCRQSSFSAHSRYEPVIWMCCSVPVLYTKMFISKAYRNRRPVRSLQQQAQELSQDLQIAPLPDPTKVCTCYVACTIFLHFFEI